MTGVPWPARTMSGDAVGGHPADGLRSRWTTARGTDGGRGIATTLRGRFTRPHPTTNERAEARGASGAADGVAGPTARERGGASSGRDARPTGARSPLLADEGILGAIVVSAIAAVPFIVAGLVNLAGRETTIPGQLATVCAGLGAAALAWRTAARWTGRADAALAWRVAAAAMAIWSLGTALWWAARTTGIVSVPIEAVSVGASLAFYPLATASLVLLSERARTGAERLRVLIDGTSAGVLTFVVLLIILGAWPTPDGASLLRLACIAGTAALVASGAVAILRRPAGARLAPAGLLALGAALLALAVPGLGALPADALDSIDAAGTLVGVSGAALVAWAGAAQTVDRRTLHWGTDADDGLHAAVAFLPLIVTAAAFAAILASEAAHLAPATVVLVACGVALTALAGFRQAVTMRDSRHARRTAAVIASQARFRTVVENASDVIVTVGQAGRIISATPSLERVTGWSPADSVGVGFLDRVHSDDRSRVARVVGPARRGARSEPTVLEFRMLRPDDEWVDVEAAVVDLREDPTVGAVVLTIRDVGERKVFESDLKRQAFQDQLTGLPNRAHFVDRIEAAVARTSRTGEPLQVLYLDLDGFKRINDSLGHDAGDRVLRVVAERLTWAVRAGDTPARLGGDEFAVLLEDGASVDVARSVAERIQSMVSAPIDVGGRQVRVGVSVGVASPATIVGGTLEGEDRPMSRARVADELIRNADVAMYEAKQRGKGRVSLYEPAMRLAAVTRFDLETALRAAVEHDEFRVRYQPIVDLATGRIVAMEALARWERPGVGIVGPGEFIAVAEETGLVRPIGAKVMRTAFRDASRWADGRVLVDLCVNLSARQLQDPRMVESVEEALTSSGLDPRRVVFEITESSLIEEGPVTLEQLGRLRALGIRLAIDDFGTGYSSLGYLEQLPVDILKIDRAFIIDLPTSPKRATLLRAIVGMANALRLTTIAEGIETDEQLHAVRAIGCDQVQGFLLSMPVEPHEAAVMVAAGAERSDLFGPLVRAADIAGHVRDTAHHISA